VGRRSGLPENSLFSDYLDRWGLDVDGAEIITHASHLLPVRRNEQALMLKLATAHEERQGGQLLAVWSDAPFVPVLEHAGDAVLMERACEGPNLVDMALSGQDDEASAILCRVTETIHQSKCPDGLIPLDVRFKALINGPDLPELRRGKRAALELLEAPVDVRPLHGDMHHGNVLWLGDMGWLAIDPKGVLGERGFDFANVFCNPDPTFANDRARFEARLALISDVVHISPDRLAQWVEAWTALSAVWSMQSGDDPRQTLEIGALAGASLRG